MEGVAASELYRTTPPNGISNTSAQMRFFGDKTFNAVGHGGAGLSIAYGSVGVVEERLEVVFVFRIKPR